MTVASDGYVELTTPEAVAAARARLVDAWKDPSIPKQQRDLADGELARWKTGGECAPFDAFAWAIDSIRLAEGPERVGAVRSLLDVGCSSGYYCEVLRRIDPAAMWHYCGVDYSEEMIRLALTRYAPDCTRGMTGEKPLEFDIADAFALPCEDRAFDVVISGCYLLHVDDWRGALREAARVSRRWVVMHRTPLLYSGPTRYFTKRAYGVECFEQHLALGEFREALAAAGLTVRFERQIARTGDHANETWVCERGRA